MEKLIVRGSFLLAALVVVFMLAACVNFDNKPNAKKAYTSANITEVGKRVDRYERMNMINTEDAIKVQESLQFAQSIVADKDLPLPNNEICAPDMTRIECIDQIVGTAVELTGGDPD